MLACLHALRTWRAQVLVVFACLKCFASSCACMFYELSVVTCLTRFKKLHAWRALKNGILRELHKMTCLACFIKCHAWRASKNGAFGVFHKIPLGVLKVSNFFFFIVCVTTGHLWSLDPEWEVMYSMESRKLLNLSLRFLQTLFLF